MNQWAVLGEYYPSGRLNHCGVVYQSWDHSVGWAENSDRRFCLGPFDENTARAEANGVWEDEEKEYQPGLSEEMDRA